MYYKRSRSSCQRSRSQLENVVWSPNYCILYSAFGVAESNSDIRILIGSWELAVSVRTGSTYLATNSAKRLARRRATSSCNAFTIATFSCVLTCIDVDARRHRSLTASQRTRQTSCMNIRISSTMLNPRHTRAWRFGISSRSLAQAASSMLRSPRRRDRRTRRTRNINTRISSLLMMLIYSRTSTCDHEVPACIETTMKYVHWDHHEVVWERFLYSLIGTI